MSKRDAIERSGVAAEKLPKFDLVPDIDCVETGVGRPVPVCNPTEAGAVVPDSDCEIDSTLLDVTCSENRVIDSCPMGAGVPMDTNQENEVVDVNLLPLHQCENITCQAQTTAFVSDLFTVGKGAAGPAAPGLPGSAVVYRGFYRQMESMDTRNRRSGITHELGCLKEKCKCRRLTCNIWTVPYPHAPPEATPKAKSRKDYDGKFIRDKDTGTKSWRTWSQIRNFRRRNQIQATINEARPTDHMGMALLKRVKTAKAIIDRANEIEETVKSRMFPPLGTNESAITASETAINVEVDSPGSDASFHSANETVPFPSPRSPLPTNIPYFCSSEDLPAPPPMFADSSPEQVCDSSFAPLNPVSIFAPDNSAPVTYTFAPVDTMDTEPPLMTE